MSPESRRSAGILLVILPTVIFGGVSILSMLIFLSVLSPSATEPNGIIYLAYVGALVLAGGLITLGVGLLRRVELESEVTMVISFVLSLIFATTFAQPASKTAVVQAKDGVPIHYSVQGKGEPALVFVHCWSCDGRLWENQVPVFSKNHQLVTIDLPGHGESGQGRKEWSIESYADDVNAVITKLKLKRVILIGSSMGGPIAVEATRRSPDRVLAIVPVDTLQNVDSGLDPKQLEAVIQQLRADYKASVTGLLNQFFFSASTPPAVKTRIINETTSRPPELAITILEAIFKYRAGPALSAVKVPIRAINSDMTPTNLDANRKYAPQFDAVIMKGTGHYPMLEDPTKFNELLAEIIQSVGKNPAKN